MKRTYQTPSSVLLKFDTSDFIAASGTNQVVDGGSGTNIGGSSQESSNTDTDGDGTPDDMTRGHSWGGFWGNN